MAQITDKIKSTWFKCVETLGQGAANLADNAKQKLGEINMETRRKELVADLPDKLMQLWKDGAQLPEELNDVLAELNTLDEELAAARAARLAKKAKPAITDGSDAEEAAADVAESIEEVAAETAEAVREAAEEVMASAEEIAEEAVAEAVETVEQNQ